MVHVRDLLAGARRTPDTTVGEIAHPVLGVPATKDLGALLRERNEQLAVVLNEYGAVAGIVTVEDILEELAGEIEDEFDLPDARITRVDDRTVIVAGSMTIDDFNEMLGTHLPQDGPRTLAGLVLGALGRRPDPGETVTLAGVEIRVESLNGLRITRLRVTLSD